MTKVVKAKPTTSLTRKVDSNIKHNDSLLMSRSFLPTHQERNLSRLQTRDENVVKASRNISKELFQLPNMNSSVTKSRLTTHNRSAVKTNNRFLKRLKTPDMKESKTNDDSKVYTEGSLEKLDFRSLHNPLMYRNTEFT